MRNAPPLHAELMQARARVARLEIRARELDGQIKEREHLMARADAIADKRAASVAVEWTGAMQEADEILAALPIDSPRTIAARRRAITNPNN